MEQYTMERRTNIMRLPFKNYKAIYFYQKPNIQNSKVTFADGSIYWEKTIFNDKYLRINVEQNILYLDKDCTLLADITRKQKIQECKRMGLI